MKGHSKLMDWQDQYCTNNYTTKSNLYIHCNPLENSNGTLQRDRRVNPKVHMETQKSLNSQSNLEPKKQRCGGITILDFYTAEP
jgi:hypothetical protein